MFSKGRCQICEKNPNCSKEGPHKDCGFELKQVIVCEEKKRRFFGKKHPFEVCSHRFNNKTSPHHKICKNCKTARDIHRILTKQNESNTGLIRRKRVEEKSVLKRRKNNNNLLLRRRR